MKNIHPKIYRLFGLVLLGIVLLWATYHAFYAGYVRLNYPSLNEFPVQGIDISHHQNKIDWQKLSQEKDQVQFVFIKATEGGDFKDTQFQSYLQRANEYSIPAGAYHFFTFCRSGKEQADHFIQTVAGHKMLLPPVIDLEFGGNCKKAVTDEMLMAEIGRFIQAVEKQYQQKVLIYTTQEFYESHLRSQFLSNPIWIRDIYKQPTLENNRPWLFWQYANRGRINGIDGVVDLNVFVGSTTEFQQLLKISRSNNKN